MAFLQSPINYIAYYRARSLARQNAPEGIHLLGMCHMAGIGCRQDIPAAQACFENAAGMGYVPAIEMLATCLSSRYRHLFSVPAPAPVAMEEGEAEDKRSRTGEGWMALLSRSFIDYLPASGCPAAFSSAASVPIDALVPPLSVDGLPCGGAEDENRMRDRIVTLYQDGAARGSALCQLRLGYLNEMGAGLEKSPQIARFWYQKAADQGSPSAMFNLGALFFARHPDDPELSAQGYRLLERAAEKGEMRAAYALGVLNFYGIQDRLEPDVDRAACYLRPAAMNGNPAAQSMLGCCYAANECAVFDESLANLWLTLAARQGSALALGLVERMGLPSLDVGETDRLATRERLHWDGIMGAFDGGEAKCVVNPHRNSHRPAGELRI